MSASMLPATSWWTICFFQTMSPVVPFSAINASPVSVGGSGGGGCRIVIAGGNVYEVGFRIIGRGTPNARAGSTSFEFIIVNHVCMPDDLARIRVKSNDGTAKGFLRGWALIGRDANHHL